MPCDHVADSDSTLKKKTRKESPHMYITLQILHEYLTAYRQAIRKRSYVSVLSNKMDIHKNADPQHENIAFPCPKLVY